MLLFLMSVLVVACSLAAYDLDWDEASIHNVYYALKRRSASPLLCPTLRLVSSRL